MLSKLSRRGLIALIGAALLSIASFASAGSPVLDRVTKDNVLRVGMSGDQPPFNAISRTGVTIGLEADLAAALAQAMDVKLEIVNMPFGDLMSALDKGSVDMVMSGVSITPERTKDASFVGPYILSGKSILAKPGPVAEADDTGDVNKKEIKLAALKNSTSEDFVRKHIPDATLVSIDNYEQGVQMVIEDKVQGMVADMPACTLSVFRNPGVGLATLKKPLKLEPIGIAVDAKDPQMHNLVNSYLAAFERTGLMNVLRKKWFEDSSWLAQLP